MKTDPSSRVETKNQRPLGDFLAAALVGLHEDALGGAPRLLKVQVHLDRWLFPEGKTPGLGRCLLGREDKAHVGVPHFEKNTREAC